MPRSRIECKHVSSRNGIQVNSDAEQSSIILYPPDIHRSCRNYKQAVKKIGGKTIDAVNICRFHVNRFINEMIGGTSCIHLVPITNLKKFLVHNFTHLVKINLQAA